MAVEADAAGQVAYFLEGQDREKEIQKKQEPSLPVGGKEWAVRDRGRNYKDLADLAVRRY